MTFPHSFQSGLVALAYAIAPSSAVANKKNPCRPQYEFLSLWELAQKTQQIDGYHGFQQYPQDGKLGLGEYADYRYGKLFCNGVQNPDMCAGRIKPKNAEEQATMPTHEYAKTTIPKLVADLKPYDINRDGYLTPEDDLDSDGVITCVDAKKYVQPVKMIKPTKSHSSKKPEKKR